MVLRIEQLIHDTETIFRLIGRITSPDVQQLKAEIAEARNRVILDSAAGVARRSRRRPLLAAAEHRGIRLRHLPQYISEWVHLEKPRVAELVAGDPLPIDALQKKEI